MQLGSPPAGPVQDAETAKDQEALHSGAYSLQRVLMRKQVFS